MTDKKTITALVGYLNYLDDLGVLTDEDRNEIRAIVDHKQTAFYISTIHIENLGTQVREAIIEDGYINVYAHTKYVYDMSQHEIDTSIKLDDIVDCAITLRANGNTTLTIDYADDIEDFYIENQDEGIAFYQFITNYLANRN